MGLALEVVDTFNTFGAANANFVANTTVSGSTTSVRNFSTQAKARIIDAWGVAATEDKGRIRSPHFHDNVNGLLFRVTSPVRSLLTEYEEQPVYPQDVLTVEMTGAAIETDGLSYLVHYDDLPGSAARLTTIEAIDARIVNLVTVEVDMAAPAAIGTRSAGVALNGTQDLLIGNTDYAILGYELDAACLSVGITGPDTANLRIGGPGATERRETRDYFVRLGRNLGLPTIPIVNSANKGGTLLDNVQVVAGVAVNATLLMAQLSP